MLNHRSLGGGGLPLSPITQVLVIGVAIRLAAALLNLIHWLQVFGADHTTLPTRFYVWALHEFPQTIVYVVSIVFVEGLYRVWRNLRRVKVALEGAAIS